MPTFELLSRADAELQSTTGPLADVKREYMGYIGQLVQGQAGHLQPTEGESFAAVRRRLGAAAKLAGKQLVIRTKGDSVYFWAKPRRGGRPPRSTA